MHRFLESRTIGRAADCDLTVDGPGVAEVHARAALRADGAIWLLAKGAAECLVDRGSGWVAVTRLRLCAGDRIRLGQSEVAAGRICGLFGIDPEAAAQGPALESLVPGLAAPVPLKLPAAALERPRRNPDTGQLERQGKESR